MFYLVYEQFNKTIEALIVENKEEWKSEN